MVLRDPAEDLLEALQVVRDDHLTEANGYTDPNAYAMAVLNNLPAIAYALGAGLPVTGWRPALKNDAEHDRILQAVRQWDEQSRRYLLEYVGGMLTLGQFYNQLIGAFVRHSRNSYIAGRRAVGVRKPMTTSQLAKLDDTMAVDIDALDAWATGGVPPASVAAGVAAAGGLGAMLLKMFTDPTNYLGSGLPGDPFAGLPPPIGAGKKSLDQLEKEAAKLVKAGKEVPQHLAADIARHQPNKELAMATNRLSQYGDAVRAYSHRGEMDALAQTIPAESTMVWWELGQADHCIDCIRLADASPFYLSVLDFNGVYPGSGHTQCGGRCRCSLGYEIPSEVCGDMLLGDSIGDLIESADGAHLNVWVMEAAACRNPVGVDSFGPGYDSGDDLGEEVAYSWDEDTAAAIEGAVTTSTKRLVDEKAEVAKAFAWLRQRIKSFEKVQSTTYKLDGAQYNAIWTLEPDVLRFHVGATTSGLPVMDPEFTYRAMHDLSAYAAERNVRFEVDATTASDGMRQWLDTIGASRGTAGGTQPTLTIEWPGAPALARPAVYKPVVGPTLPEVEALGAWPNMGKLRSATPEVQAASKVAGGGSRKYLMTAPGGKEYLFKVEGAEEEAAAAELGMKLGLRVPPQQRLTLDGFFEDPKEVLDGVLQPIIPDSTVAWKGIPGEGATFDAWTDEQVTEVARQAILDFTIGNIDAHPGNWLVDDAGRIWGIDRANGFRGAVATSLDARGFYGTDQLVFGRMMRGWGSRLLERVHPDDVGRVLDRLDAIDEAAYRTMMERVIPLVASPFATDEQRFGHLLERKLRTRKEFEKLWGDLVTSGNAGEATPEWKAWAAAGGTFEPRPVLEVAVPVDSVMPDMPEAVLLPDGLRATAKAESLVGDNLATWQAGFVPATTKAQAVQRFEALLPAADLVVLERYSLDQVNALIARAELLRDAGFDMKVVRRFGDWTMVPAKDKGAASGLTYGKNIALKHTQRYGATGFAAIGNGEVVGHGIGDLFAHEFGHASFYDMNTTAHQRVIDLWELHRASAVDDLSRYADTTIDEWVGEAFAAITAPGYVRGTVPYDEELWRIWADAGLVIPTSPLPVAPELGDAISRAATDVVVPPMPPGAIPQGQLSTVKDLGGSTGAKLVEDQNGIRYVDKFGNSPAHIESEYATDAAYRAVGLPVPNAIIYDTPKGPLKRADYIGGQQLNTWWATASAPQRDAMRAQLQAGMAMDALLANWDVIGLAGDNIIVDAQGMAWRIDNGGSLRFRAQGAAKGDAFGPTVSELDRFRDTSKNTWTTKVFGGVSDAELRRQTFILGDHREAILAALPEKDRELVGKRLDDMLKQTSQTVPAPDQPGLWAGPASEVTPGVAPKPAYKPGNLKWGPDGELLPPDIDVVSPVSPGVTTKGAKPPPVKGGFHDAVKRIEAQRDYLPANATSSWGALLEWVVPPGADAPATGLTVHDVAETTVKLTKQTLPPERVWLYHDETGQIVAIAHADYLKGGRIEHLEVVVRPGEERKGWATRLYDAIQDETKDNLYPAVGRENTKVGHEFVQSWLAHRAAPKLEAPSIPIGPPIPAGELHTFKPGIPQQYLIGGNEVPLNTTPVEWSGHVPDEPPLPSTGATKAERDAARAERDAILIGWQDVYDGKADLAFSWSDADRKAAEKGGLLYAKVGDQRIIARDQQALAPLEAFVKGGGDTNSDAFWHLMGYSDEDLAKYDAYEALGHPMRQAAGVIIVEPDGRIWVLAPKNEFGGYQNTHIKGGVDPGESTAAAAVREVREESGFSVELDAFLGDYENDARTGIARMYIGHRVGGGPLWAHQKETYEVRLLDKEQAAKMLTQYGKPSKRDQNILVDAMEQLEGVPPTETLVVPASDVAALADATAPPTTDVLGIDKPFGTIDDPLKAPAYDTGSPVSTAFGFDHAQLKDLAPTTTSGSTTSFPYNTTTFKLPDGSSQKMFWKAEVGGLAGEAQRLFWANSKKQLEDPHTRFLLHVGMLQKLAEVMATDPTLASLRVNEALLDQIPKLRELLIAGGADPKGAYVELSADQVMNLSKAITNNTPLIEEAGVIPTMPLVPTPDATTGVAGLSADPLDISDMVSSIDKVAGGHSIKTLGGTELTWSWDPPAPGTSFSEVRLPKTDILGAGPQTKEGIEAATLYHLAKTFENPVHGIDTVSFIDLPVPQRARIAKMLNGWPDQTIYPVGDLTAFADVLDAAFSAKGLSPHLLEEAPFYVPGTAGNVPLPGHNAPAVAAASQAAVGAPTGGNAALDALAGAVDAKTGFNGATMTRTTYPNGDDVVWRRLGNVLEMHAIGPVGSTTDAVLYAHLIRMAKVADDAEKVSALRLTTGVTNGLDNAQRNLLEAAGAKAYGGGQYKLERGDLLNLRDQLVADTKSAATVAVVSPAPGSDLLKAALDDWFEYDNAIVMKGISAGLPNPAANSVYDFTADELAALKVKATAIQQAAEHDVLPPGAIYRGMSFTDSAAMDSAGYIPGHEVTLGGLTAVSPDPKIAGIYADTQFVGGEPGNVTMLLKIDGLNIHGVVREPDAEYILPAGTKLSITSAKLVPAGPPGAGVEHWEVSAQIVPAGKVPQVIVMQAAPPTVLADQYSIDMEMAGKMTPVITPMKQGFVKTYWGMGALEPVGIKQRNLSKQLVWSNVTGNPAKGARQQAAVRHFTKMADELKANPALESIRFENLVTVSHEFWTMLYDAGAHLGQTPDGVTYYLMGRDEVHALAAKLEPEMGAGHSAVSAAIAAAPTDEGPKTIGDLLGGTTWADVKHMVAKEETVTGTVQEQDWGYLAKTYVDKPGMTGIWKWTGTIVNNASPAEVNLVLLKQLDAISTHVLYSGPQATALVRKAALQSHGHDIYELLAANAVEDGDSFVLDNQLAQAIHNSILGDKPFVYTPTPDPIAAAPVPTKPVMPKMSTQFSYSPDALVDVFGIGTMNDPNTLHGTLSATDLPDAKLVKWGKDKGTLELQFYASLEPGADLHAQLSVLQVGDTILYESGSQTLVVTGAIQDETKQILLAHGGVLDPFGSIALTQKQAGKLATHLQDDVGVEPGRLLLGSSAEPGPLPVVLNPTELLFTSTALPSYTVATIDPGALVGDGKFTAIGKSHATQYGSGGQYQSGHIVDDAQPNYRWQYMTVPPGYDPTIDRQVLMAELVRMDGYITDHALTTASVEPSILSNPDWGADLKSLLLSYGGTQSNDFAPLIIDKASLSKLTDDIVSQSLKATAKPAPQVVPLADLLGATTYEPSVIKNVAATQDTTFQPLAYNFGGAGDPTKLQWHLSSPGGNYNALDPALDQLLPDDTLVVDQVLNVGPLASVKDSVLAMLAKTGEEVGQGGQTTYFIPSSVLQQAPGLGTIIRPFSEPIVGADGLFLPHEKAKGLYLALWNGDPIPAGPGAAFATPAPTVAAPTLGNAGSTLLAGIGIDPKDVESLAHTAIETPMAQGFSKLTYVTTGSDPITFKLRTSSKSITVEKIGGYPGAFAEPAFIDSIFELAARFDGDSLLDQAKWKVPGIPDQLDHASHILLDHGGVQAQAATGAGDVITMDRNSLLKLRDKLKLDLEGKLAAPVAAVGPSPGSLKLADIIIDTNMSVADKATAILNKLHAGEPGVTVNSAMDALQMVGLTPSEADSAVKGVLTPPAAPPGAPGTKEYFTKNILDGYTDNKLTSQDSVTMLKALGYTPDEAAKLLLGAVTPAAGVPGFGAVDGAKLADWQVGYKSWVGDKNGTLWAKTDFIPGTSQGKVSVRLNYKNHAKRNALMDIQIVNHNTVPKAEWLTAPPPDGVFFGFRELVGLTDDEAKPLFISDHVLIANPELKVYIDGLPAYLQPTPDMTATYSAGVKWDAGEVHALNEQMALDHEALLAQGTPAPVAPSVTAPAPPPPITTPSGYSAVSPPPAPVAPSPGTLASSYGYDPAVQGSLAAKSPLEGILSETPLTKLRVDTWDNGVNVKWATEMQGKARIVRVRDITGASTGRAEALVAALQARFPAVMHGDATLERILIDKKALAGTPLLPSMLTDAGWKETKDYFVASAAQLDQLAKDLDAGTATWMKSGVVAAAPVPTFTPGAYQPVGGPFASSLTSAPPQATPSFIYGYNRDLVASGQVADMGTGMLSGMNEAKLHETKQVIGIGEVKAYFSVSPTGGRSGLFKLETGPNVTAAQKRDAAFAILRHAAEDGATRPKGFFVKPEFYDQVPGLRQLILDAGGAEADFPAIGAAVQMNAVDAQAIVDLMKADSMGKIKVTAASSSEYLGYPPDLGGMTPIDAKGASQWKMANLAPVTTHYEAKPGGKYVWSGITAATDVTGPAVAAAQVVHFADLGATEIRVSADVVNGVQKFHNWLLSVGGKVDGEYIVLDQSAIVNARRIVAKDALPPALGGKALPYSAIDAMQANVSDVVAASHGITTAPAGLQTAATLTVDGKPIKSVYAVGNGNVHWSTLERGSANIGQARSAATGQMLVLLNEMAQNAGLKRFDIATEVLDAVPGLKDVLKKAGATDQNGYLSLERTKAMKLRDDIATEVSGAQAAAAGTSFIQQQAAAINWPVADELKASATASAKLGGQTTKVIYLDKGGSEWLFKPGNTGRGAVTDKAVAELAERLGLPVPPVRIYHLEVNGKVVTGSLQKMVPGSKGIRTVTDLTPKQQEDMLRHSVLDWLVNNDDAHPGNYLVGPDGELWSIDKTRSFVSWHTGHDVLSTKSDGNGAAAGPPVLFEFFRKARTDPKLLANVHPQTMAATLRALAAMTDEEYAAIIRPAIEATTHPSYKANPAKLLAEAIERKHTAATDLANYLSGEVKAMGASAPKEWQDWVARGGQFNLTATRRDLYLELKATLDAKFGAWSPAAYKAKRAESQYRKTESVVHQFVDGGLKSMAGQVNKSNLTPEEAKALANAGGTYGAAYLTQVIPKDQLQEWMELQQWATLNILEGGAPVNGGAPVDKWRRAWNKENGTMRLVRGSSRFSSPGAQLAQWQKDGLRLSFSAALERPPWGAIKTYFDIPFEQVVSSMFTDIGSGENEVLIRDIRVDQIYHISHSQLTMDQQINYHGPIT